MLDLWGKYNSQGNNEKEILEQALDAVVTIDCDNLVTFFNPAAEKLWGYKREEVLGKNVKMLVPAEIRGRHDDLVNANRTTGEDKIVGTSREIEVVRRDGSKVWCELALSRIGSGATASYSAFVKDITEIRDARETINQTLEQAVDAVVTIDENNNITFFNRAAEKLWGYSRNEVVGNNVKMLVPAEIKPNHDSFVDANRNTGENKIVGTAREVAVPTKDGSSVWCELTLSKVEVGGKILYTAFLKNITEQRKFRETINQTLEQAIDAVVTIDERNAVTFFNSAAERLWGYRRDEVLGRNVKMLVPQQIQSNHDSYVNANRTTGVNKIVGTSREIEVPRKDGTNVWCSLALSRVEVGDSIVYTAFVKDITKEREGREVIRQTLEQALDAVVTIDEANNVTFFNQAAERLWGYQRDEVIGNNVRMLVPADIQSAHDQFVNSNRAGAENKIVGTSREVPVHRKDGTIVYGALSLSKVSLDGKILYTAFVKDVTEEVRNREQLKILSLVANETSNSVIITDAAGFIEYANPGFTRMTGLRFEEVKGKKPGSVLQGELTDSDTVQSIRAHLHSQQPFYEEILNYTNTGSPYWISLSINPVFDEAGRLVKFVSVQADITETKQKALESSDRIEAIQQSNAVVEWDANGTLTNTNSKFRAIFGLTEEEISKNGEKFGLGKLLGSNDFQQLLNGENVARNLSVAPLGKEVHLAVNVQPIKDYRGTINTIVMYASDETQQRAAINESSKLMSEVLDKISSIATDISDISRQTNLLSLNAGIESAQAGETGRGFSIIAAQIRRLAAGSSDSAKEINDMIESTRKQIEELNQLFAD